MRNKIYGICLSLALVATSFNMGIMTSHAAEIEDTKAVTAAELEEAATISEETTAGEAATSSDADKLDVTEAEEVLAEDTLEVEAEAVRINATNFPDENFRKYIKENFDEDNDGIIDNIENITSISIYESEIHSLKGIEFFWGLKELHCGENELTSLDVSKNTELEELSCHGNKLTSLDVSKNTALRELFCDNNKLTSLDVSKNIALQYLMCNDNKLTSLDVNTALQQLFCDNNKLTSLDVGKDIALCDFTCNNNELTSLDVSKNTALAWFECSDNRLTSLDVSKNTALRMLLCSGNKLTSLDVNTALLELFCSDNELTDLDVSKSMALAKLECDNNELTSLDVSKNKELEWFYCNGNKLTNLDVSKNAALRILSIDSNITIDISSVLYLYTLSLYVPQLKGTADLSNITGIEKYMSGSGWNGDTKKLTYELKISEYGYAYHEVNEIISLNLGNVGRFASYQGYDFSRDAYGNVTCEDHKGNPVINEFKCDGTYTYYFQADGTAMRNRLTYHPDGTHVIYFDENGHEVFSNFHHVEKSIAGEAVDDLCFFDVYGHMYVDVMTYDQAGEKLYYVNPYGVIEQGKWFEFSDTCVWAGTANKVGKGYGYANADGTLMINTYTYDWLGRFVYMQGNGHIQ